MRNKIFFSLFFVTLLYSKDTCYSVQLLSSVKPIAYQSSFPKEAKVMHINGIYTLRYGCFERVKEAKPALKRLKQKFPQAYIVSTYRFRFQDSVKGNGTSLKKFKKNLYLQSDKKKRHLKEFEAVEEVEPSIPFKTIVAKDKLKTITTSKKIAQTSYSKTNSCFTIELFESKKPIKKTKLPLGVKVVKENGFYIARYGCFESATKAKSEWLRFKKDFPTAIIIPIKQEVVEEEELGPILKKTEKKIDQNLTISHQQKNKKSVLKPSFYKKVSVSEDIESRCSTDIEENLVACRDKCMDDKKSFPWEDIDLEAVENFVDTSLQKTVPNIEVPKSPQRLFLQTEQNKMLFKSKEKLLFYSTATLNINEGQIDINGNKRDNQSFTITTGLKYKYYFFPKWYFFTDDRGLLYISKDRKETKLDVKELFISSDGLFDNQSNFLIGRKYLKDDRSWYFKTYLDTVGFFNKHDLLLYEFYVGTRLTDSIVLYTGEDETLANLKNTNFLFGHISYEYYKDNTIEGFYIQEDGNLKNVDWIGVRMQGKVKRTNLDEIAYWLDIAHAEGVYKTINYTPAPMQEERTVKGLGFEIGGKYTFYRYDSAIAASIAYGSGGDNLYRQPSFTNNRTNYLSKDISFRHYGSFFNPELSNIWISSLYLMHHLWGNDNKTAIIAYHNFMQDKPSSSQYFATFYTFNPNGEKKSLGNEIDFILHYDIIENTYWRFVLGYFLGGEAFDSEASKKDGFNAQIYFKYLW
ncbi:hypothetical protein [Nitrosophilus labii]|uniref:hypothetical protein n=1 Tax=Nitrosophilus labii TaxID=2706014 RepID=UPI00165758E4|nr:hypothetical protein [Nitrosophilus labii]